MPAPAPEPAPAPVPAPIHPLSITSSEDAVDRVGDIVENTVEDLMTQIMEYVKSMLQDVGIKPSTLPKVIGYVMEAIETTPMKGKEQKDFCLKVIDGLIQELHDSDEKKILQDISSSGGIEGTIELVVSASKGELNINNVGKVACTSYVFPLFQYCQRRVCKS